MRHCTKKVHYHATRIIQIILLLIFSLRTCSVNGQISHHSEYEIATGRRSGVGSNGVGASGSAATSDSNEDESISNQPNGMHTNGEILGPKSFPLSAQEPSCEELRAMWIFSKRQSRAAEMSNEIPTYRDPFAYNVWEPYPSGRGIGSRTISHYREPARPVFGRVISREPVVLQRLPVRSRILEDVPPRMYGSESRSAMPSISSGVGPRRYMQYRFGGSPNGNAQANTNNQILVHQGSFQKLKELIWTERAKELTQQRKAEELAARAAALKEIAAGQLINRQLEQNDEPMLNEENLSPDQQEQHYHHNTDSRISIGNSQQPGGIKSIFSGNPSNPNSARSGRLSLPSMIGSDARERGNLQRSFPMRPSHFRERNRVLFRQSTPSDYYQRESRSEPLKTIPYEQQFDIKSRPNNPANNRDITFGNNNNNDIQYQTNIPISNNDIQQQSTEMQQQLADLYQKLYQIDQISFLAAGYPSISSAKTKLNYDDNNNIIVSDGNGNGNSRKRRSVLPNINYVEHPLSSDSY
ncbi:uncharacterized protein LOC129920665 [Episyrphus balteatus]|uniref:uncharacterized protein LOC129920665 n=1 Tax=Episyrphus balteatus TaxID=286459 RepID=UPI00248551EA|nr:uncharacterized protein LOC129920665 [Episyrphus balteatus]XP_055858095.1 uncharacterized protein LOC129920665 [Episyrphus balteatus]